MYYLSGENKGADQLRSYCEADLRLCFRIGKNLVFSRRGSNGFSLHLFPESSSAHTVCPCLLSLRCVNDEPYTGIETPMHPKFVSISLTSECFIFIIITIILIGHYHIYLCCLMGKPTTCLGENKGADQRLCFRYSDSTIPLLLKFEISSF